MRNRAIGMKTTTIAVAGLLAGLLTLPLPASSLETALPSAGAIQAIRKTAPVGAQAPASARGSERRALNQDLWLDPSRVAVFPADGTDRPVMRDGNKTVGTAGSAGTQNPTKALGQTDADATTSPVFVDRSGRARVLPGGVIVTLPAVLDERQARQQLLERGLSPSRRLGPRLWLLESPAGMASLDLAERLARDPRFEAAEPNWWSPPVLK